MVEDIGFRMSMICRWRLRDALRVQGAHKSASTMSLVGCTGKELKTYLQSLFKKDMSWDNYGQGRGKWNIDHIIPCASFGLSDFEQQKKCFHFTNLQPLWAEENWAKRDSIPISPVKPPAQEFTSQIQPQAS